jgi:hypothetical protein
VINEAVLMRGKKARVARRCVLGFSTALVLLLASVAVG